MSAFGWALLAAACWGLAPLLEKAGLRGAIDPVAGVVARTVGVLIGLMLFLPLAPRTWTQARALPPRVWLLLGLGGLLASIIGQICFYRALKTGEVSRVVPVGASYPVIACLLGIFVLREPLTAAKAVGIGLVVAGTLLLR
jgi:transporter family protein